ncbi:unnamed protein product [marine sediment metagenome]|jgi:hypothetical protein|uniref:Uncharacterized protein n=1 Tax=marine sediment metagenome TaxID=412755 RepID=X1TP71_9ZZZZ
MAYGAGAGAAVAARAAAIAKAIKASGAIVRVEPSDFSVILSKTSKPLVVLAEGGFLKTNYQYLTSYKGLVFFTKSPTPLQLPGDIELVVAKKIWIPG